MTDTTRCYRRGIACQRLVGRTDGRLGWPLKRLEKNRPCPREYAAIVFAAIFSSAAITSAVVCRWREMTGSREHLADVDIDTVIPVVSGTIAANDR